MNEAVDRVLEQREAMDRGFPAGIVLSGTLHLLVAGVAFVAAWLGPREPLLKVAKGFAVAELPKGGGGPPQPDPAPAAAPPVTTAQAPEPAPPAPAPPPKVIKPPREEPRKGLPPPDTKKTKPKPERSAPAPRYAGPPTPERSAPPRSSGTGTATASTTPGVGLIGPSGPGTPDGSATGGDFYLGALQQKIWSIWTRQIKTGFTQPVIISLTILADGSLEDGSVRIVQSSGVQLLDNAAQRAVFSAAPFGPLPRSYGTNRITIQAVFQPTP